MAEPIGCGTYAVQLVGRGGSPLRCEVPQTSLSFNKKLNASGDVQVSVPSDGPGRSPCCEVFDEAEPWRDEVLVYRGNDVVHVGPLVTMTASRTGTLSGPDLFGWLEQRTIGDFHGDGDVSDIFHAIFTDAMA